MHRILAVRLNLVAELLANDPDLELALFVKARRLSLLALILPHLYDRSHQVEPYFPDYVPN